MKPSSWTVVGGLGLVLCACGNSGDGGGSGVTQTGGAGAGGSNAGSGGLSLPPLSGAAGSAAGSGGAAGAGVQGGSGGTGGGGGAQAGSGGAAGTGGKPPSAPHPTATSIYFCLGEGCPYGYCSGGDVPSCDELWSAPLTEQSPLCKAEISGSYCLVTNNGTWVIECTAAQSYVQKCPGNCSTSGAASCL